MLLPVGDFPQLEATGTLPAPKKLPISLSSRGRGCPGQVLALGCYGAIAQGSASPRNGEGAGWDLRDHLDQRACWVRRGS